MNARVPSAAFAGAAATLVVLAAALVVCAGCGGRPGSPEELYATLAKLNGAGETGKIWDLLTADARRREIDRIEGTKKWLLRNPDPNEKITRQYHVSRDEFMALSPAELYRRENAGNDRAFIDAKIVDRQNDPKNPDDVVVTVQSPLGTKFFVRTRPEGDGWGLVDITTIAAK